MAMRLQDLVVQVPHILQTVDPGSLGPLLATCTELRQHVHQHVTKISVDADSDILQLSTLDLSERPAPSITQAHKLKYNSWPQLKVLDLTDSRIGPAGVAQLIKSNPASLQHLRLQGNRLGSAGVKQLTQGNCPQLISLDLQSNSLNAAALSELASVCWPSLQNLSLGKNELSAMAVSHLLKGNWPNLQHLDLSHNSLPHEAVS